MKILAASFKNLNFGTGKTTLISDFDGTFMPFKQKDLLKRTINKSDFHHTFDNFWKFMSNKSDKFELDISSGRNLHEWLFFVNMLDKMGLKSPLPKKMISSNGADVFIKTPSNDFVYDNSANKKEEIKQLSGWNDNIKTDLMNLFEKEGYKIIEPYINSNEFEYNKEFTIQAFYPKTDKNTKFASFRKDDNLHLNIALNQNSKDRKELINISQKIRNYLRKNNIKAAVFMDTNGKYSGGYPILKIIPKLNNDELLTKQFDIKKEINRAKKENDLVVIAGDGINDKEMLNPLNYINLPSNIDKFNTNEIKNYFENHSHQKRELRKLPLKGIVVTNKTGPTEKTPLKLDFINLINEIAGVKKLFVVTRGNVQTGLEAAIDEYSKINKKFRHNMNAKEMTLNKYHHTFMQIDGRLIIGPQLGKKKSGNNIYHLANKKEMEKDLKLLKPFEITDIIDLRKSSIESMKAINQEKELVEKNGIKHHSIEFDAAIAPTKNEIKRFFNIIKNAKGKVYLHCHIGQDRTSMFAALYTAYTQGRTLDEIEKYLFDSRNLFREDGTSKKWQYLGNPLERRKFFSQLEALKNAGIENHFDINKFDIEKIKRNI